MFWRLNKLVESQTSSGMGGFHLSEYDPDRNGPFYLTLDLSQKVEKGMLLLPHLADLIPRSRGCCCRSVWDKPTINIWYETNQCFFNSPCVTKNPAQIIWPHTFLLHLRSTFCSLRNLELGCCLLESGTVNKIAWDTSSVLESWISYPSHGFITHYHILLPLMKSW
jgi:hypothetical protein